MAAPKGHGTQRKVQASCTVFWEELLCLKMAELVPAQSGAKTSGF